MNIRKLNFILVLVVSLFIGGSNVLALSITKGEAKYENNITYLPMHITINEGEKVKEIKVACSTDNDDVKCEVVKSEKYNAINAHTFVDGLMKPTSDNSFFKDNQSQVEFVVLKLTNNTTKNYDVGVSLKNSTYIETVTNDENEESDETKTLTSNSYSVNVNKKLSSNAKASLITFSKGKMIPTFNPDITSYTVYNIQDTINSVIASYECQDANTCSDINGWSGGKSVSGDKITLNQGENNISIELQSEDGVNKITYNFKIIRGETTFNSSKLKGIIVGEYDLSPTFSSDVLEYSVVIPNNVSNLSNILKITKDDEEANATIENHKNIKVGENTVKIIVDNSNGDNSTTYVIKVTRLSDTPITVVKYIDNNVSFKRDSDDVIVMPIDEFKKLYNDEYKKIQTGEYKFSSTGDIIDENTVTEPVTTTTAKQISNKKDKKNNNNVLKLILIIVGGLIIIVISGILIFKRSSDKNLNEDVENKKEENVDNKDNELEDIDDAISDLTTTKQYNIEELLNMQNDDEE